MAVDKEFLRSEKGLVFARLEHALNTCYANPCNETQIKVLDELVYAYMYNLDFHVPVDFSGEKPTYELFYNQRAGYVYQACTTPEELVKCKPTGSIVISIRNLFKQVCRNSLAGLVLDPKNSHGVIVFMTRENIQRITEYALRNIEACPEDMRDFFMNEI